MQSNTVVLNDIQQQVVQELDRNVVLLNKYVVLSGGTYLGNGTCHWGSNFVFNIYE